MSFIIIRSDGTSLTLDNTIGENHDRQLLLTSHPVEAGAAITDHIQAQPAVITVIGVVTETPIGLGQVAGLDRVLDARGFLEIIQGELVDIVSTRFGTLIGYALQSWPHQVRVFKDLPITLTFREIRTASVQSVAIPPLVPVPGLETGATTEQDLGPQGTEDLAEQEPEKDAQLKSYAATGADAIEGWFR